MPPEGDWWIQATGSEGNPFIVPLSKGIDFLDMILNDPMTNIQDLNIANFDQDGEGYCCTIVLAAKGYPESYEKGFYVDMKNIIENENIKIFHAGTMLDGNKICSTGGRILTVNTYAKNKEKAISIAYENIKKIKVFQDKNMNIENNNLVFFREDIGS